MYNCIKVLLWLCILLISGKICSLRWILLWALSNVFHMNSNELSKIYMPICWKINFCQKLYKLSIIHLQYRYHLHIYIWNTFLLKKWWSCKHFDFAIKHIFDSISLTLIGRSCKSSCAVYKSFLMVTTKKLKERRRKS